MSMNTQGRPTQAGSTTTSNAATFSGHRGLDHEEPLLFEIGGLDKSGVDLPAVKPFKARLGGLERTAAIGLPGLSEPETMRHYVRLSRKNYAIDSGLYPLGSCTMKHNARLNEKMARLPGFGDVHPLQPQKTVQGALAFTIHLTLLGEAGLRKLAALNHAHACDLAERLGKIKGVRVLNEAFFNEFTIRVQGDAQVVLDGLADKGVLGGVRASRLYRAKAGVDDLIIVASTEVNSGEDRAAFSKSLAEVMG
jgi:hypothetical protein